MFRKPTRRMQNSVVAVAILMCYGTSTTQFVFADDNTLTDAEKADGWILLFDGTSLQGWKNNTDQPVRARIEDGAINPYRSGGYLLVYEKPFGDFVLKCEV